MSQEFHCRRCGHLLFKGSLKALLARRHDPSQRFIEPTCPACGLVNRFTYRPEEEVRKAKPGKSLFGER